VANGSIFNDGYFRYLKPSLKRLAKRRKKFLILLKKSLGVSTKIDLKTELIIGG
jgi:hypothetical protein